MALPVVPVFIPAATVPCRVELSLLVLVARTHADSNFLVDFTAGRHRLAEDIDDDVFVNESLVIRGHVECSGLLIDRHQL